MFTLDGLSQIRKVKWKNLRAGSIILGGVHIDGSPLPELQDFPVLTDTLIYTLLDRYIFLENHQVLVADAVYNYNPQYLANEIKESRESIQNVNKLRNNYQTTKKMLIKDLDLDYPEDEILMNSNAVEHDYLRKDSYNSFSYMYGLDNNLKELPSFFHKMDLSLSIGDLLTKKVNSKFNIPKDSEVMVHLVVDFSKSMDNCGKLDLAINAVNEFYRYFTSVLKNSQVMLYAFSDKCQVASYPFDKTRIHRGDTSYSSFMKKVLHHRDREVHNKIILLTDGLPSDFSEALKIGALIKKNKVDYTQIIFQMKEEQRFEVKLPTVFDSSKVIDNIYTGKDTEIVDNVLSDEALDNKVKKIYSDFTKVAEVCGGNQIILKVNELINVVTVECYDKYMGILSLIE